MPEKSRWTVKDIPDLTDRTAVVTGANSGIGFHAARALAAKNAQVVMACRDEERARAAMVRIRAIHNDAELSFMPLDLADLESVRAFARTFVDAHARLNVLINNAGVMALPYRNTADGFEMQMGVNHFGHFALTGLLMERLLQTPAARVVTVSSLAHRAGAIRFNDVHWEKRYDSWGAYFQSKLANLLFALELQRRLAARGSSVLSVACHPGYAATELQYQGPRMKKSRAEEWVMRLGNTLFAQSARMGAQPLLYAATAPGVGPGDFIGPAIIGAWGRPTRSRMSGRARNPGDAARLWEMSVNLTGVRYAELH
jgi:NAD(P)-dependent dehydrogenase (short-subunit alcohol dehydrogenase family)